VATGASGKTPDEVVAEMADDFYERCPELLEYELPSLEDDEEEEEEGEANEGDDAETKEAEGDEGDKPKKKKDKEPLDSLMIVLSQENERFNKLLKRVKASLTELKRAIMGEVVMNADLDAMYTCLLNNQVPTLWSAVAFPSLKPLGSWYQDLIARIAMFDSWCKEGAPNSFWMPGFFFPQGFMTGVLQNFARKYKIAIDTLKFRFAVLDSYKLEDIADSPEDGVYVHGFFMDGARWDPEGIRGPFLAPTIKHRNTSNEVLIP
jgi:dynein heavy chain